MAATPTFVNTIEELRNMKSAFEMFSNSMSTCLAVSRHPGERQIAMSMIEVGQTMSKRLQEITLDVSKLAINYSKEDLDDIMEAMSK